MISAITAKSKVFLTGYTFIEVFIVIIIIGILVGISLPNLKRSFNELQINSFTRQLQGFMNYLHERSIVEGKIIYLDIDKENKEYWAKIKEAEGRLKTYPIPQGIDIELNKKVDSENKEIIFYPDGTIDKVTVRISNRDKQIILTTEGSFGKVKAQF